MVRDSDIDYLKRYLPKEKLNDGIERLKNGEAPQYIVGDVDFYGNIIRVNSNVLIPRFETELLVEKTINFIRDKFDDVSCLHILDIGTGSGCISIALQKELGCKVVASDISLKALDVARDNANLNNVDVDFICGDIFSNIDGKFDVIVSNPPYIRVDEDIEDIVKNNEPHLALYARDDGLYFYRKILSNASKYLRDKFVIAFEIGELQGEAIRDMVYFYFSDVDVSILKDYSGKDRYVFVFSE